MALSKAELDYLALQIRPFVLEVLRSSSAEIEEIELAPDVEGLTTLPVYDNRGGTRKIVRIDIKDLLKPVDMASEEALAAVAKAKAAAESANTAADSVNDAILDLSGEREAVNVAISNAEAATVAANTSRLAIESQEATRMANESVRESNEADRIELFDEMISHEAKHPVIGENMNWWIWDSTSKSYVDTGIMAQGGYVFPTFEVDGEMNLVMTCDTEVFPDAFEYDKETGKLYYVQEL